MPVYGQADDRHRMVERAEERADQAIVMVDSHARVPPSVKRRHHTAHAVEIQEMMYVHSGNDGVRGAR